MLGTAGISADILTLDFLTPLPCSCIQAGKTLHPCSMANLSPVSATGMKRTSSQAGIEDPSGKRPRQTYHRFHSLKHQPTLFPGESEAVFVNEEQAHEIFEGTIAQIFSRVHDRRREDEKTKGPGLVEPRVLPALREHAEECMAQRRMTI